MDALEELQARCNEFNKDELTPIAFVCDNDPELITLFLKQWEGAGKSWRTLLDGSFFKEHFYNSSLQLGIILLDPFKWHCTIYVPDLYIFERTEWPEYIKSRK